MSELQEKISKYIQNVDQKWNYITPEELHKKIQNNNTDDLFLLDIRKPENYKEGHIPGSTNIFWLDLFKPENLAKLPKDKTIVLICYVGHTASQAMALLSLLEYKVSVLKFGMGISPVAEVPISGWTNFEFETTKGEEEMEELKFSSEVEALQYLADLTGNQIKIAGEDESKESPEHETKEKIEGGKSSGKTIQEIANKHGVSPKLIEQQLTKGIKIELEHTEDEEVAKEIALDHLVESPIYYNLLEKMEAQMETEANENQENEENS